MSNIKINDEENENIEEECSQESNSESDDDIRVTKPKGVSNLIEIENPNRNPQVANNGNNYLILFVNKIHLINKNY